MMELTEKQFNVIKYFCEIGAALVFLPLAVEHDTDTHKQLVRENIEIIGPLVDEGFMTDVTSDFADELEKIRIAGERGFKAFMLTEKAVKMFLPNDDERVI